MKAFFKDIFEYHHYFNQELAKQMIEYENNLSERTIPLFLIPLMHNKYGMHELQTKKSWVYIKFIRFQNV